MRRSNLKLRWPGLGLVLVLGLTGLAAGQDGDGDTYVHMWAPPFCGDPLHQPPAGDVNRDCYVNGDDLVAMAEQWLERADPCGPYCQNLGQVEVMYMPYCGVGGRTVDGLLDDWTDPGWVQLDQIYSGDPPDIASAKYTVCWDPCDDRLYSAVIVEDTSHFFEEVPSDWNSSDRAEIYVQADPNGGNDWGAEGSGQFDKAQHYVVGYNDVEPGLAWGFFGYGTPVPANADLDYQFGTRVSGTTITYEVGAKAWTWYGGHTEPLGSVPSEVRQLEPGMQVGFDVVADSRWGAPRQQFGMVSANRDIGKYIDAENFQRWELLNPDGTKVPPDCHVDGQGFTQIAIGWMDCTHPGPPCNFNP